MNRRSSAAHRGCRAGRDCHTLEEKVREQREAGKTPAKKRNSLRHKRRSWKNAGEEGLCRLIAWRQNQRTSTGAALSLEGEQAWIPTSERRSKPRAGIQRGTPKLTRKTKAKPACNLDVIQQSKENYHKRTLMRQIKKVVMFAKRCGRDADAIRAHLMGVFMNSKTKSKIPVSKYQRRMLEESRGCSS